MHAISMTDCASEVDEEPMSRWLKPVKPPIMLSQSRGLRIIIHEIVVFALLI